MLQFMGLQRVGHNLVTKQPPPLVVSGDELLVEVVKDGRAASLYVLLYHVNCFMFASPSTSLVAQMVKRLPIMRDTGFSPWEREDLLEKEMATHSSILAWKTPWTEKPGRVQSVGSQSRTRLSNFTLLSHRHIKTFFFSWN